LFKISQLLGKVYEDFDYTVEIKLELG